MRSDKPRCFLIFSTLLYFGVAFFIPVYAPFLEDLYFSSFTWEQALVIRFVLTGMAALSIPLAVAVLPLLDGAALAKPGGSHCHGIAAAGRDRGGAEGGIWGVENGLARPEHHGLCLHR